MKSGFLWTLEESKGTLTSRYLKKYFLVVPLCGVLALSTNHIDQDLNRVIQKFSCLGWVCGGSIVPILVVPRNPLGYEASESRFLYPLILTVRSDDSTTEIFLACETEESRDLWINSFEELIKSLMYIKSCLDHDHLPRLPLYQSVIHSSTKELHVFDIPLSPRDLSVLKQCIKCWSLNYLQLRRISLQGCSITDSHLAGLNSLFINCEIDEVDLSRNYITSKGVVMLCQTLSKCHLLRKLNFSTNLIGDSSTAPLVNALLNLSALREFDISRNSLTSKSSSAFASILANHNCLLEVIDFSFNELGDEIGILVSFLMKVTPSRLKSINLSFCGLTDKSVKEIAGALSKCSSLQYLNLQGAVISADVARLYLRSCAYLHTKTPDFHCEFGGICFVNGVAVPSLVQKSLKFGFLEITEKTVVRLAGLRRQNNSYASIICLQFGNDSISNDVEDILCVVSKYFGFIRSFVGTISCHVVREGTFLVLTVNRENLIPSIISFFNNSVLPSAINARTVFLQWSPKGENPVVFHKAYNEKRESRESYLPALSPFVPFVRNLENAHELPLSAYIRRTNLKFEKILIQRVELDDKQNQIEMKIELNSDFSNIYEYENSLRERRLINERLILAVRRLYAADEVTSGVAKFWEGMFGNRKYRKFSEVQLVNSMQFGHQRFCDESVLNAGLSHLFPAIARREQLYQATYGRNIEEIERIISNLPPIQGGYAFIYASRLCSEIASLVQQFASLKLLATSYLNLSLVESFLLNCGKLSYCGKEMFEAVELRQMLYAEGISRGGVKFSEYSNLIKSRAMITNLLISRDINGLKDVIMQFRSSNNLDSQLLPEIQVGENILVEYEQSIANLTLAADKREMELLDLALSMASYSNFFSTEVERCIQILNEISRNPVSLIRPIVEGLRNSKMAFVDKGFEILVKMGLCHPALDAVVCSKIHAVKARIIQDDSVKDKLVKVCLALKNGFHVPPGEIMELYRKSLAIKLNKDKSLKAYFKILLQFSKRYMHLQKQEKQIQQLIANNDIYKLSKLLAGRGSGKLVLSFPTAFARDQWYSKLFMVCNGNFPIQEKEVDERIIFQGTFDKAARSGDGKLRGWRKRYFVLTSIHLTYYTRPHGDRKGFIRVLNGGVKLMSEVEANGREFCLEIEEGRDLAFVSPDLLEEARRHVRFAKIMEIEASLKKGIQLKSITLLSKMLQFAKELEVMLDYNLMNEAKQCLQSLQTENLLRNLYVASVCIPKSQHLQELSVLADKLLIDPNLPALKRIRFILSKSEIEQEIFRCKCSLVRRTYDSFVRSMKSLSKIDFGTASLDVKATYVSMLLQFVGARVVDLIRAGFSISSFLRFLKESLNICQSFYLELEVMDLVRIVMKLFSRYNLAIGSKSVSNLNGGTNVDSQTLLDDICDFPRILSHQSISKFPYLRFSTTLKQTELLGFGRRKSSVLEEVMTYSSRPIEKSLLKYELTPIDSSIASEAFVLLQVVMGDSALTVLKKWKRSKILRSSPTLESVVLDLVHLAVMSYQQIQDELYFQVCKQLNMNPKISSCVSGLLLLSTYFHAFPPSAESYLYIQNFLLEMKRQHLTKRSKFTDTGDSSPAKESILANLLEYCITLVSFVDGSQSQGRVNSKFILNNPLAFPLQDEEFALRVMKFIFLQQKFWIHVVLMTGEVIHLQLQFSQYTPQFLLRIIKEYLLPPELQEMLILKRKSFYLIDSDSGQDIELFNEYGKSPVSADKKPSSKPSWKEESVSFLPEFELDGFGFFEAPEEWKNDFMSIPIQPISSQSILWNDDVQWKHLFRLLQSVPYDQSSDIPMGKKNTLVFRRTVLDSKELFFDSEYEIFGAELGEYDQSGRAKAWRKWLTRNESPVDNILPSDFVQVDLLFAEDSRYVNSRLALMSEDSFHYLLALELALAWFAPDTTNIDTFPDYEISQNIISHCSPSVRSCYLTALPHYLAETRKNYGRTEISTDPKELTVKENGSDSSEDSVLAAIDGHLRPNTDDSSSIYSSSEESLSEEKHSLYVPLPVRAGQELSGDDKDFLIQLLRNVGIDPDSEESRVDTQKLWSLMAEFHLINVETGVQITSPKYRYFMKKAYHHYLISISPLIYGQHLFDAILSGVSFDESVVLEHLDFQEKYIEKFSEINVLIGLCLQGFYLLAPADWSIIFFSPFWDLNEFDLITNADTQGLTLNFNGLKLLFESSRAEEILHMVSFYSQEVLKKGLFPFGVSNSKEDFCLFNSYSEQDFNPNKNDSSRQSTSSMVFQRFIANFSLLPLPPVVESTPFAKNSSFFSPPPSEREVKANARFEEEKLEQEITKLAEQILLEKNQQQIMKGRNDMVHSNVSKTFEEDDDLDEDPHNTDTHNTNQATNFNRNIKLKRKNRSVFQGNRLKSQEEIAVTLQKDRLDANVCGISGKESLFNQRYPLPLLPSKYRGKVVQRIPIEKSVNNNNEVPVNRVIGFQDIPSIESRKFNFLQNPDRISLQWTKDPDNSTAGRFPQSKSQLSTPEVLSHLSDIWKWQKIDSSLVSKRITEGPTSKQLDDSSLDYYGLSKITHGPKLLISISENAAKPKNVFDFQHDKFDQEFE